MNWQDSEHFVITFVVVDGAGYLSVSGKCFGHSLTELQDGEMTAGQVIDKILQNGFSNAGTFTRVLRRD